MKERIREAAFNLIGPAVKGKHAIDLFAGTGALGLEALSRGAVSATLIERHFPTAQVIQQNVRTLGVEDRSEVVTADAFIWLRKNAAGLARQAAVVFCSPPYDFYVKRRQEMVQLIADLYAQAPRDSLLVVECDERFETSCLPAAEDWDVRPYPPAVIAVVVV